MHASSRPLFLLAACLCFLGFGQVFVQALDIQITPPEVIVAPGGVTTLTATVKDGVNPAFQWRKNGVLIPGETKPQLTIFNQYQNVADYDVLVEADNGSDLSKTVHFEVSPVWDDQLALRYPHDQPPARGPLADSTNHTTGELSQGTLPRPIAGGGNLPFSGGWDFNGATAHLIIPPNPTLGSLGDPKQGHGLTLAFWVKMPGTPSKPGRLGQQIQSDQAILGMNKLFYVVPTGEGGIYVQFGIDYYYPFAAFTTKPINDGAWHHVLFTCDFRSAMSWCYVDGVRQKFGPLGKDDFARISTAKFAAPGPVTDEALHLGSDGKGKKPWKGALADLMLFTKPIKDDEAKALVSGSAKPGDKSPIPAPSPVVRVVPSRVIMQPGGTDEVTVKVRAIGVDAKGPVSYRWSNGYHMSKEMVQITGEKEPEATITLHGVGDFGVVCTITNGNKQTDTDYGRLTVASNLAPAIGTISCDSEALPPGAPHKVTLRTIVNDDGLPNPPAFTKLAWSEVSGPGQVVFAKPWASTTEVVVPGAAGDYVLRLTANDGALSTTSDITVTVGGSAAVAVSAEAETHLIDLNSADHTTLSVSTKDGSTVSACHWKQTGGPSAAVLATPEATATTVTVDSIGLYTFEAKVTTPGGTALAKTWLNSWQPGALPVHAGSSRLAWLPNATLSLQGSTSASSSAKVHWSTVGGPSAVTFTNSGALATSATFSAAGTYELQLDVVDGKNRGQSRMVVEVYGADENFGGYTTEELAGYTTDLGLTFDTTGLEWSRIKPAPAPGVHPRILFNPQDLPDLRKRLKDGTELGPIIMGKIRDEAAILTKDPEIAAIHNALIAGDVKPFLVPRAPTSRLVDAMKYEAFRTLIDEDAPAAAKDAAAVATLSEYLGQVVAPTAREQLKTYDTKDWRVLYGLYAEAIAWSYDFLYNNMTTAQRASVRRLLVRTTDQLPVMGLRHLPGLNANNSNWLPLTSQGFLFTVLAIEGEEGADPTAIRAYTALVNRETRALGWPDGSLSEGGGKGWLGCEQYLALAKRGSLLVASDTFRNHLRQFFLQCIVPEGGGFTMDEMNGGTAIKGQFADDFFVTKYLYPKDPLVDFVFRNAFSSKGEDSSAYRVPFVGGNLLAAICAENFQSSVPWDEALAKQIRPVTPKTCWFPYRGLLVTRSDWTPDATRLYFQPRCVPGGHTNPDRNCFVLHALGRTWVPMEIYQSGSGQVPGDVSMPTSIVRVDDHGSGDAPSGEVDVFDSPRLTSATGDARDAYRVGHGDGNATSELIPYTFNQKHHLKMADGWANMPMGKLPDWYNSLKQDRSWSLIHPDARAFRSAALVRPETDGPSAAPSYILIADDIQMDAASHNYKWRMMLPGDLRNRGQQDGNDVIYTDPGGKRCLLVRLLSCSAKPLFILDNHYQYFDWPWLDISVDTVSPDFRVLLYPFKAGESVPKTSWQGDILILDHGNGVQDRISFTKENEGWTKIRMAGE